jgi:hypothetical protein
MGNAIGDIEQAKQRIFKKVAKRLEELEISRSMV